jgi:hypothetical protein
MSDSLNHVDNPKAEHVAHVETTDTRGIIGAAAPRRGLRPRMTNEDKSRRMTIPASIEVIRLDLFSFVIPMMPRELRDSSTYPTC